MIQPEAVYDLTDEELFKAAERIKGDIHRGMRAPQGQLSKADIHEMRLELSGYHRVLSARLRATLETLS